MTKMYYMVAVGKDDRGEPTATRITEGYITKGLGVDLSLLPPGTVRVAVMEKRAFDMILDAQRKPNNPTKTST